MRKRFFLPIFLAATIAVSSLAFAGKLVPDGILDAMLVNEIKTPATTVYLCSDAPTDFAGIAAVALADVTIDGDDWTGPANGDTSGRKLTVNAQSDVEVDTTGTATHIAVASGDTLLFVTTCTSQAVVDGQLADIPAFDIEVGDAQ